MKIWCRILMGIIGIFLFFYMMLVGWGLEIKAVFPIIAHYIWWFISLVVLMAIEQHEKENQD